MGRSVPKPNKYADGLLLAILFTEVAVVVHTLVEKNEPQMLQIFVALLFVVALCVNVTKFLFRVIGGWFSRTFLQHLGDPLKKKVTMKKWCDQSWQLTIHASMSLAEYLILRDETWWQNTATLWNYGSTTSVYPEHKFTTKLFYITQLAIWIYTAFSCKFLEEVRKDYLVMMSHHVITIALVAWSYKIGFLPIGVVVLFLHDLSDVPLDILKMANYLKLEGFKGFFLCEILFVVLLVDWGYFRIFLYPTKALYSTIIECREASLGYERARDFTDLFPQNPGPPSWFAFNVLLCALYVLHIWWGFLIVRLVVTVTNKGAHNAGKEHYEGSSESEKDD